MRHMPSRPEPQYGRVAIVGVGLIGGSIGLALRERGLATEVVGIGRRESSLQKALACKTVDRTTTDLAAGASGAEVVIVASPVDRIVEHVQQAAAVCSTDALITDVGSVKASIAEALRPVGSFVASHPLAGDHRTGPDNARADLLEGKTVVVTPTEATPAALVDRTVQFWEQLGAKVVQMAPAEHDRALAATSHLPHLIAAALAGATPEEWLPLAASGWGDTTRIAAADPNLWTQIFAENRAGMIESLDRFSDLLARMRTELEAGNLSSLTTHLNEAKRIRDALGD